MRGCSDKPANGFERHGRAVKVGKMMAVVDKVIALMPAGTTDAQAADRFTRFRQEDRNRVAMLAGVRVPSEETWQAFIAALREREELNARFAEDDGFERE